MEPLSATSTSPVSPDDASQLDADVTQAATVSASSRHGMRIVRSRSSVGTGRVYDDDDEGQSGSVATMCGRYVASSSPQAIAEQFGALLDPEVASAPLSPSWNVAPTNTVYAVVPENDGAPHVRTLHWGLVPHWAKDTKGAGRMINARAETLAEKPTFKGLLTSRRCLVPMDGFYEWRTDAPTTESRGKPVKQPFYIHRADGKPLAAAGLWTVWRDKAAGNDAAELRSVTIVTTGANRMMASLHDRMPVFLERDEWSRWLDPSERDTSRLLDLLDPADEDVLQMHTVSREVNSVRNKGSHLIEPVEIVEGVGELGGSGDLWSAGGA